MNLLQESSGFSAALGKSYVTLVIVIATAVRLSPISKAIYVSAFELLAPSMEDTSTSFAPVLAVNVASSEASSNVGNPSVRLRSKICCSSNST
ncbi:MAG: hypothetical protein NE334_09030 [Lentisphaeraceae bacterium]|nr:hypothetical protein [Lentisphaeraceae bacterium]